MPKKKIYFMGLLANTDSSILNLKLSHGFKIEALSYNEGIDCFSKFEKLPDEEISRKLFGEFPCLNPDEKKFYFISNSFETTNVKGMERINAEARFYEKFVRGYLNPTIRVMRLFKEGNICMPRIYYYFVENNTVKGVLRRWTFFHISPQPKYTLETSEIPDLQRFIKDIKLPFKESFLQLAFESFELSYQTPNPNIAFLVLMIALESLFNPGLGEVRYRISRNATVLLSKCKSENNSWKIFEDIQGFYDERSKIIHGGRKGYIKWEDVLKLRYYVRESIKEVIKINKNKNDLLKLLDSSGFGDRPLESG